jgi:hypothetical protein
MATTLGLKNLSRAMDNLLAATTHKGEDWADLQQVYSRALGQWSTELGHVVGIIGGANSQEKHAGQEGVIFTTVSKDRQKAAVKFLNENAFQTPAMFIKPEILRRLEPSGTLARIRTAQLRILTPMVQAPRLNRLVEQSAIDGAQAYSAAEYLADLRNGLYSELLKPSVKVDAFRRNLQRAYLEILGSRLNSATRLTDDQRPLLRGELQSISAMAKTASVRAADRETRLHLEDLRDEVAKLLDPRYQQQTPNQPVIAAPSGLDLEEGCFVDYAIY